MDIITDNLQISGEKQIFFFKKPRAAIIDILVPRPRPRDPHPLPHPRGGYPCPTRVNPLYGKNRVYLKKTAALYRSHECTHHMQMKLKKKQLLRSVDETAPVYYITTLARGQPTTEHGCRTMRVISLLEAFHTLPAHFGPALVDDSARLSIGTRQDTRVFRVGMFWTAPWASSPRPFLPTAPTSPQMRPCGHSGLAHRATRTAVPARAALAWPRRFLPVSCSGHTCACTGSDRVGIARALQGCCNVLGRVLLFSLRLETKTETKIVFIFRD